MVSGFLNRDADRGHPRAMAICIPPDAIYVRRVCAARGGLSDRLVLSAGLLHLRNVEFQRPFRIPNIMLHLESEPEARVIPQSLS